MEIGIGAVIALVVLFCIIKFFSLSISLLWNGIVGVIMLWLLNMVGSAIDFHLPITFVSALIAGFLGVPGVILLVAYQLLSK